jgi:Transglutaminase-like superfamily
MFANLLDRRSGVIRFQLVTLSAISILAIGPFALGAPATKSATKENESQYAIVTAKTKTVKATDTFAIYGPEITAKAWVLIAAQPPEMTGQRKVSARLVPGGEPLTDLARGRKLLRSQILVNNASLAQRLNGRAEYHATLYSRNLVRREPGETYAQPEKLSSTERKLSLAPSETLDFLSPGFQQWLKKKNLHKSASESDVDFGRRAFLAIKQAYHYHYSETLDRHASATCQNDGTDCGGLSALFAATMRANKIPARLLIGHWAKSEGPKPPPEGRVAHQCHCKSEFYAEGVGWVPVDLSGAVQNDKAPEGLRYFGHENGDFLTLHLDYDVEYDSGLRGVKTQRHLQNVRYHVKGNGNFDGVKIEHKWEVAEGAEKAGK